MAIDDFFKRMDRKQEAVKQQEDIEIANQKAKKGTESIKDLETLLNEVLPGLLPELGAVSFDYDERVGAYGDFTLKGKKFRLLKRLQPGTLVSRGSLVLLERSSSIQREIGSVVLPREKGKALFPEQGHQKFQDDFANLLRKELSL